MSKWPARCRIFPHMRRRHAIKVSSWQSTRGMLNWRCWQGQALSIPTMPSRQLPKTSLEINARQHSCTGCDRSLLAGSRTIGPSDPPLGRRSIAQVRSEATLAKGSTKSHCRRPWTAPPNLGEHWSRSLSERPVGSCAYPRPVDAASRGDISPGAWLIEEVGGILARQLED